VIREAVRLLQSRTSFRPATAVVLGSGLGARLPKNCCSGWKFQLARFPLALLDAIGQCRQVGNRQNLTTCRCRYGRNGCTYNEGYTPAQVTFGVRVLGSLGRTLIVFTNAAGGIQPGSWSRGGCC